VENKNYWYYLFTIFRCAPRVAEALDAYAKASAAACGGTAPLVAF
jgi:hypothetical protein